VKPILEKKVKKNENFGKNFLKNVKIGKINRLYRPIAKNKIQSPHQNQLRKLVFFRVKKFTNKSNNTQI
jgi:hypothetical protein